jgi:hypothetical protein
MWSNPITQRSLFLKYPLCVALGRYRLHLDTPSHLPYFIARSWVIRIHFPGERVGSCGRASVGIRSSPRADSVGRGCCSRHTVLIMATWDERICEGMRNEIGW